MDSVEIKKTWIRRLLLYLKEPYIAWAIVAGYVIGGIMRYFKWPDPFIYFFGFVVG